MEAVSIRLWLMERRQFLPMEMQRGFRRVIEEWWGSHQPQDERVRLAETPEKGYF